MRRISAQKVERQQQGLGSALARRRPPHPHSSTSPTLSIELLVLICPLVFCLYPPALTFCGSITYVLILNLRPSGLSWPRRPNTHHPNTLQKTWNA